MNSYKINKKDKIYVNVNSIILNKNYELLFHFKIKNIVYENKKIILKGNYLDNDTIIFMDNFKNEVKKENHIDIHKFRLIVNINDNIIQTKIYENDIIIDISKIKMNDIILIKTKFNGITLCDNEYFSDWICSKIIK
jgi:hypothetical protein